MTPSSERAVEHFLLPWAGLALFAGASAFFPTAMRFGQEYLLLAVFLLAAMPHICCDPWLPAWERGRPLIWGDWVLLVAYVIFGAVGMAALGMLAPVTALVVFLLMTGLHWGTGDSSTVLPTTRDSLALGLARGGLLLHAPVVFAPTEWASLFVLLPMAGELGFLFLWFQYAPLVVLFCLSLEVLITFFPSRPIPSDWRPALYFHLAETVLLVLFFWATSPWVALAGYFLCCHHWRYVQQVARLQASGRREPAPNPLEAILRFAGTAAPLALVVLASALAMLAWMLHQDASSGQLLAAGLLLLAMMTPAHLILGLWLQACDHRPSLWRAGGPPDRNLPPLQRGLRRIFK